MNTNLFFISTSYDFVKKKRIRFGDLLVVFLQLQLTWPRPESILFLHVNVLIGLYDQIVLLYVFVVFVFFFIFFFFFFFFFKFLLVYAQKKKKKKKRKESFWSNSIGLWKLVKQLKKLDQINIVELAMDNVSTSIHYMVTHKTFHVYQTT